MLANTHRKPSAVRMSWSPTALRPAGRRVQKVQRARLTIHNHLPLIGVLREDRASGPPPTSPRMGPSNPQPLPGPSPARAQLPQGGDSILQSTGRQAHIRTHGWGQERRAGLTLIPHVILGELEGQGALPTAPAPAFLSTDPEAHSCLTSLGHWRTFWSASWLLFSESADLSHAEPSSGPHPHSSSLSW